MNSGATILSMKKSKLIIITLISLSLTSCNLFNLFGKEKPKVRTNAFFSQSELSKYLIKDLPSFNQTEGSRLEIYHARWTVPFEHWHIS